MPSTDRRKFLAASAASALGCTLLGPSAAAEKPAALKIIDTHQHLWDLRTFKLPWITRGSDLDRNYLISDYAEATKGLPIAQTVYMEVDVAPEQQPKEVAYVTDLSRQKGSRLTAAVVSGRPASEGFAAYITPHKGAKFVKGVRQVLHGADTPPGYCLDRAFVKGIRLLGELGLSFDLCMRWADLGDAVKLIDLCPDTRFILDHCGNPDMAAKDRTAWKRSIDALAGKKQLVCKVSGIVASAGEKWSAEDLAPVVDHVLDAFGPSRVIFGSDWPVCLKRASLRQWVEALQAIVAPRKAADQRALFHDNAVRLYGLKPVEG